MDVPFDTPDIPAMCAEATLRRSQTERCGPSAPRTGQTGGVFGLVPVTKGRLLLATPPLDDPNFDRTVIYVLEHQDDGAVGVVINRPSDEALDERLDRWIDLQSAPSSVFSGGPVEANALIALAATKDPRRVDIDRHEALTQIVGDIASADLTADPAIVANENHQ